MAVGYITPNNFQQIIVAKRDGKTIVTQEQSDTNDYKPFKKIPLICEIEDVKCIKLQQLLKAFGVGCDFKIH